MKINYRDVKDVFDPKQQAVSKGNGKFFCLCCKKTMDEKQFFKTNRIDKFNNGILPYCKTCVTMGIDDSDPLTFIGMLKEIDVPYIPLEWRGLLSKKDIRGNSIFGKYVSKMRLNNFKRYSWQDTERLVEEETAGLMEAFRQETDSETEAKDKFEEMMSLTSFSPLASINSSQGGQINSSSMHGIFTLTEENSKYGLTNEEIAVLKRNWGEDHSEDQYREFEDFLDDMKESYVLNDPIALSNARFIAKMTIKTNRYLDIDDIESATKLSRQLDLFIKSANLAPVQQKDRQQNTFAISQLAYLIEKEGGFIPNYFEDNIGDKIDQVLEDMKEYTRSLVRNETNIEEMVENAEEILSRSQLPEAVSDYDEFELFESEILEGEIDEDEDKYEKGSEEI